MNTLGRLGRIAALVGPLFAISACGDSGLSVPDGGADLSASTDLPVADLSRPDFSGIGCGAMTCGAGEICCLRQMGAGASAMCSAASACTDGGVTVSCDGPEDCTSGNSCCVTAAFGAGGDAGVSLDNAAAMCQQTCPGSATMSGGGSITTRLCHGDDDCAGYQGSYMSIPVAFNRCCSRSGLNAHFCAPAPNAFTMNLYDCP
jgi:hypothetical protein